MVLGVGAAFFPRVASALTEGPLSFVLASSGLGIVFFKPSCKFAVIAMSVPRLREIAQLFNAHG